MTTETNHGVPSIILDVDDVLVDFVPHWLRWIEATYGVRAEKEQITEWLLSECTPELAALGEEKICKAFSEPGFHLSAPPMEGALDVVRRLNKDYRVYFVTARHGAEGISETFKWFKKYLPKVQHAQIVFSRTKDIFVANAAIDDKGDHLRAYQRAPHLEKSIIIGMEQPHNLRDRDAASYWVSPDASGWTTIEKLIRNML